MRTRVSASLVVCLLASPVALDASVPNIVNGKVVVRAVDGTLASDLPRLAAETKEPRWVAWAVPTSETGSGPCCHSSRDDAGDGCSRCGLEPGRAVVGGTAGSSRSVSLEASRSVSIFVRLADGVAGRVAAFSADCEIDAGGRAVVWLDGVAPAQSVAWLAAHAGATNASRKVADGAVMAIALHADASAVPTLIGIAKQDRSPHVRGQALFWLAQKAGARVADTIARAVIDDPDTEVKTRAVFALSQLPKDEGVPRLIQVARTNRNHEVRKQAMFWLGQSDDPRALAFFEEVLSAR